MNLIAEQFAAGRILRQPVGFEPGYWAGAPGAFYAADESAWYLTYRLRRPRGVPPDRGGEARIARSTDGQCWQDVWSVTKDQFRSASVERCALRKGADGQWRHFVSCVDPGDGRWCIALLAAPSLEKLEPSRRRILFTAKPLGLEGVKDPWIMEQGGTFYMFLSVAVAIPRTTETSHATLDIFNTGDCLSASGLAVSSDLDHWEWQGVVFAPVGRGWDAYCRRINSVVRAGDRYFAFFDGSASVQENYEEKIALAASSSLRAWKSLCPGGPLALSPNASGSIRYVDAHLMNERLLLFYEFARADGAHDLRMTEINGDALLPRPD